MTHKICEWDSVTNSQIERDATLAEVAELDARKTEALANLPQRLRENAKVARALAVAAITVTTMSGKVFDGDETSQNRMARAILALEGTGTPDTLWVLANNEPTQVTSIELTEALALAGAAQSAIWVIE